MAEWHPNVFLLLSVLLSVNNGTNTVMKIKVALHALSATQENNVATAILILKV